jgi:1-acyl-sn-glycerol-3-phosphate acyltransferase
MSFSFKMSTFHPQILKMCLKTISKIKSILLLSFVYLIYLISGMFFIILFPAWHLISFKPSMHTFINDVISRWFLLFLTKIIGPLFGVYKIVEQSGFDAVDDKRPLIIVSNHRSMFDGIMLISILKKTGVLMKAGYAKLPVFSSLVKHSGFISVDSRSLDSLSSAKNRCIELLSNGYNLLIFPEGTRSRSAKMQPFKDLAFRLSIDTKLPVLPVIMHTDFPFLAKIPNSLFPPKMRITLRSLEPCYAQEGEKPFEFAERVRKIMAEEVKNLDKGTVWETL